MATPNTMLSGGSYQTNLILEKEGSMRWTRGNKNHYFDCRTNQSFSFKCNH